MKTKSQFSEAEIMEWIAMRKDLENVINPFTKENLMTESEVCTIMGVTDRTMRKYRKMHYIGFIKISGQIFYFKNLLYKDLLAHYYEDKNENPDEDSIK